MLFVIPRLAGRRRAIATMATARRQAMEKSTSNDPIGRQNLLLVIPSEQSESRNDNVVMMSQAKMFAIAPAARATMRLEGRQEVGSLDPTGKFIDVSSRKL